MSAQGRVAVTGGAGYIGAHVVDALRRTGRDVLVVDDLSTGRAERIGPVPLVRLDLADPGCVAPLGDALRDVASVVHLAAGKSVPESVAHPLRYAERNVTGLVHLLRAVTDAGVPAVLFSSSAAVYGTTRTDVVTEAHPTAPVNPYGRSKLVGEWLLRDVARASGLRTVALRYFNVVGAGRAELADTGASNLVTASIAALRAGRSPVGYGDDYDTPDGTCVRDFVDVRDIADAHLAALDALERGGPVPAALNVGTGVGTSVAQVLDTLIRHAGRDVAAVQAGRRAGDPPSVVADVSLIAGVLGWRSRYGVAESLADAWLTAG